MKWKQENMLNQRLDVCRRCELHQKCARVKEQFNRWASQIAGTAVKINTSSTVLVLFICCSFKIFSNLQVCERDGGGELGAEHGGGGE